MHNLGKVGEDVEEDLAKAEYYRAKTIAKEREAIKNLEDLRRELPEHFKIIIHSFDKLAGQDKEGISDHMIHSLTPALRFEIIELRDLGRSLIKIRRSEPAKEAAIIVNQIRERLVAYRDMILSNDRNKHFPTPVDARNALIHILVPLGNEVVQKLAPRPAGGFWLSLRGRAGLR